MISRRILRIKVMQALYAYFKHDGALTINQAEKELLFSIQKSYELYHYLLLLPIEISNYAESRINISRNKKLPTHEDLNPNTRFIDNKLIHQIRINNQLLKFIETKKMSWVRSPELIKNLYNRLIDSKQYKDYMANNENSYVKDKALIVYLFSHIIPMQESLYSTLEEESIFWNDEIDFIIGIIIKTIKKFKEEDGEEKALMHLYKNQEDAEFAKNLFRKTILKRQEYKQLIEKFCQNWDIDRVAFMDFLLMEMAITEVIEFPSIPTKVSFNEYIELSKYYSTAKSNIFINGILDKTINYLKKENKIHKQGRGLIGEL